MPKNYLNQRDIPSVDFLIENLDSNNIPRPLLSTLVRDELKKIRKTEKVTSRSEIIELLNKKKIGFNIIQNKTYNQWHWSCYSYQSRSISNRYS